jgi:NAD(P)-dependent dehydrogenase (short-subunit alcohol dehydrogenase family)
LSQHSHFIFSRLTIILTLASAAIRRHPPSSATRLPRQSLPLADRLSAVDGTPITPADQAEAYFLLVSKRLSKTTGQIITVDGGLHEAFLR